MIQATGVCPCGRTFKYTFELGDPAQLTCYWCGKKKAAVPPEPPPAPVVRKRRKQGPSFAEIIASTYE